MKKIFIGIFVFAIISFLITGTLITMKTGKFFGHTNEFDANNVGMQVRVGDKVLFNKFAGSEVKLNEETLLVLRQVDLIAIIGETNE